MVLPLDISVCEYVCFSGGGMRALAGMLGCVMAVEDVLKSQGVGTTCHDAFTKGFAGTSMGAIFAAMCALGMSAAEIQAVVSTMDIKRIGQDMSVLRYYEEHGIASPHEMEKTIANTLESRGIPMGVTLREFEARTQRRIVITGTHLNATPTPCTVYMSGESYPDMPLMEAILISTALPFVFPPRKSEMIDPGTTAVLVDGGLLDNFPFYAFGREAALTGEVLGFFMERRSYAHRDLTSHISYARTIIEAATHTRQEESISSIPEHARPNAIEVPTNDIEGIDFDAGMDRVVAAAEETRVKIRKLLKTMYLLSKFLDMLRQG